jgi:diaminohydroxyphosphoribosylaminopyrimidine deaminase/5-amino-6-(5-phosphoribosylamino)uracil reductase
MPIARETATANAAWMIVLAAARAAERAAVTNQGATFGLDADEALRVVPAGHPDAVVAWRQGQGWVPVIDSSDPRRAMVDLYLPICSATQAHPITVAHLGQSLDGFIATHAGESQFVTGEENILHLHRLRALCDAIVVGSGTVAADDPLLTTRRVDGPNPLRVIFDPARRLEDRYRVFRDDAVDTLYVCGRSLVRPGETQLGRAELVGVDDSSAGAGATELMQVLRRRGCARVFVEGGGVTVSTFLEANLLDRLQMAVAPLLIGDGRPAIRLAPRNFLRDCHRPRYRVFRMGGDVLFDCELTGLDEDGSDAEPLTDPPVTRII